MSCRIVSGPLTRALVVENPSVELDALLREQGMDVLRLDTIPAEDGLKSSLNIERKSSLNDRRWL